MSALDPRDADKFGKLVGLLGSNHDGERAAAALKATEFLRARQMGWTDIAETLKTPPVVYRPEPVRESCSHVQDALRCLQSVIAWKDHERAFLVQMSNQRRRPSDKQRDWLDGLLDRVVAFERRRAA